MTFIKQEPRLYGRRQSRPLKPYKQNLMNELLPHIQFQNEELEKWSKIVLEIGFGGGEHLAHLALNSFDTLHIGCEPFINGVASLLGHIDENRLTNIRVHHGDARKLMTALKPSLFDCVYLLYPDPWPKARHSKRRFIQNETLEHIHKLLKPNGTWFVASDHPIYQEWILEHISGEKGQKLFDWINKDEITQSWENWTQTRYEAKAIREGRQPQYFILKKKD